MPGAVMPQPDEALARLCPDPGTMRCRRHHLFRPSAVLDALREASLWDALRGGDTSTGHADQAARVVQLKRDRGVFALTLNLPSDAVGAAAGDGTCKAIGAPPSDLARGLAGDGMAGASPGRAAGAAAPQLRPCHVIVKAFRDRDGGRALGDRLRRIAKRGRADREWDGLWMLRGAGIDAAEPLMIASARAVDGGVLDLLVMPRVPGTDLLRAWAAGALRGARGARVAERVGTQIGAMIAAPSPVFNRDHKASNIIVGEDDRCTIIDAAGVQRWRMQSLWRMPASLWIETLGAQRLHPELFLPSQTQRWRVLRACCARALDGWAHTPPASQRRQVKSAWRAVARIVEAHGDPVPADDPLG
jgi:hypothetical protein